MIGADNASVAAGAPGRSKRQLRAYLSRCWRSVFSTGVSFDLSRCTCLLGPQPCADIPTSYDWGCAPSRLVRCTNPATTQPSVATRRRTPSDCSRATAARSSKNPNASATASRWAAATTSATGSDPSAHNNDTLFGAENVTSNARTDRARPRHQLLARHRVLPVDQGAQLVGLHHPRQPQPLRPPARPHPRRLPHPGVVLVDTQRHRRNQILPIRQPRHRQHPPPPPTPSPSNHPPSTTHPHPTAITPPTIHPSPPTSQTGTDTCHPPGGTQSAALTTTRARASNRSWPGRRREGGEGGGQTWRRRR